LAAVPSIGRAVDVEPGSEAAGSLTLEGLYERHSQSVFRVCLSYLRKRDEAEDAAQTTFLYALRALRRGVVPSSESAWLLKIARNVCLNRFDAVRRRGNLELIQDPCVLEETAAARPGQELDLIGLQAALERLPERQRQAILLREWQGLSYAEIAAELGLTTSAVETLLFRARRSLARELGEDETRRGLDLASLLGSAKAFLGGSAAKLAMGAAAVATVGVVAPAALHATHPSRAHARTPAPQPHGSLPASRPVRAVAAPAARAVGRAHPVLQSRAAPPKPASAQAPAAPAPSPGAAVPAAAAPAAAPAKPPETPAAGTPNAAAGPAGAAAPALPDVTPALPVPVTVPAVPDVAPVVQTVASALPALPAPPPPATPALPTVSVTPPLH
jgi:RNA polymerase sigma factor (sigma-70 family)